MSEPKAVNLTDEQRAFLLTLLTSAWKARAFDSEELAKTAIEIKALLEVK